MNEGNRIIRFLNVIAIAGEKALFASNAMMNEVTAKSVNDVEFNQPKIQLEHEP